MLRMFGGGAVRIATDTPGGLKPGSPPHIKISQGTGKSQPSVRIHTGFMNVLPSPIESRPSCNNLYLMVYRSSGVVGLIKC